MQLSCDMLYVFCVQRILKYVNKQVKKASNKQKLVDYQAKMDTSAMEKAQHPIAHLFKVGRTKGGREREGR